MFFDQQSLEQQKNYIEALQAIGSISNLFSENNIPYLYYRAAENIFCDAFGAMNLSRGDITFDAIKDGVGIALKTFQHRNGNCVEKIAEFNDAVDKFQGQSDTKIMGIISDLRNKRISAAVGATSAKNMIYHLVTRKEGRFEIHEEELEFIDTKNLKLNKSKTDNKTIWFTDGKHEYKFSKSKSTLYKRFYTNKPIKDFKVEINPDPMALLLNKKSKNTVGQGANFNSIVLPLYSAQSGEVELKSGLNQWNAGGRKRDKDEVYIPIPAWIHKKFEGFFPYDRHTDTKEKFQLLLPNQKILSAKICQGKGKGFMSKPNKELGKWILRDILSVPEKEIVTLDHLHKVGIDSVVVTKLDKLLFKIDFAETGSYKEFEDNNKK